MLAAPPEVPDRGPGAHHRDASEPPSAGHTWGMPAPLIEFPADDSARALRFWHGVLGVELAPRAASAGSGWEADTGNLRLGVHDRGRGPGDTASLPYFTVADMGATIERVRALGGSVIHPGERWAICPRLGGQPLRPGRGARGRRVADTRRVRFVSRKQAGQLELELPLRLTHSARPMVTPVCRNAPRARRDGARARLSLRGGVRGRAADHRRVARVRRHVGEPVRRARAPRGARPPRHVLRQQRLLRSQRAHDRRSGRGDRRRRQRDRRPLDRPSGPDHRGARRGAQGDLRRPGGAAGARLSR